METHGTGQECLRVGRGRCGRKRRKPDGWPYGFDLSTRLFGGHARFQTCEHIQTEGLAVALGSPAREADRNSYIWSDIDNQAGEALGSHSDDCHRTILDSDGLADDIRCAFLAALPPPTIDHVNPASRPAIPAHI